MTFPKQFARRTYYRFSESTSAEENSAALGQFIRRQWPRSSSRFATLITLRCDAHVFVFLRQNSRTTDGKGLGKRCDRVERRHRPKLSGVERFLRDSSGELMVDTFLFLDSI